MTLLFLKGFGDTSELVSLMCILSKKGDNGKYKIMNQLEMDGIAVNIQNTEKNPKILISKVRRVSTLLRKEEMGFKTSVLKENEIDAGFFFFLISKSTKRKQPEFLLIELIYIIYTSRNLF